MKKVSDKSIEIIECFSEGKKGVEKLCEDAYAINESFVAVIDGATSIGESTINGKTPGRFAAELVKEAILNCPFDYYVDKLINYINSRFQATYQALGILDIYKGDLINLPKAVMAVYSKYYNEVWIVGDCQCFVRGKVYNNSIKIDEIASYARSIYLEAELKSGKSIENLKRKDTGREYIAPLIRSQQYFQNTKPTDEYSFEVINGYPIYQSEICKIQLSESDREIVLASDGYPFLKQTLEESEEALKITLKEDPLCFRQYKSTKGLSSENISFDDRTYIRFKIN